MIPNNNIIIMLFLPSNWSWSSSNYYPTFSKSSSSIKPSL